MRKVLRARTARCRDAGAAAIEFALIFVAVFAPLMMGTLSAGLAYSRQSNITQAAREGSRFGATLGGATSSPTVWLQAVEDATRRAAGEQQDPTGGYDVICVAYVETNASGAAIGLSSHRHTVVETNTVTTGTTACPNVRTPLPKSQKFVQVVLVRQVTFNMLFAAPQKQLDTVSVTPYESVAP